MLHGADFCDLIERRCRLIVAIAPQHGFEFLNLRIRLSRAVPQIIVFHGAFLLLMMRLSPFLLASREASAYRGIAYRAPNRASAPYALRFQDQSCPPPKAG